MEQKHKGWTVNKEVTPQFHRTVGALVEALIKPDCLKRDLFYTFLLIVMKENDFLLLKGIDGNPINIVDYMITSYKKARNINEAVLTLNGFQNMPVKIIACPLDDTMLIIATIPELYKETYSLCLKLAKYVNISPLGLPSHFTNLTELFTNFKDKIVNPVKGTILNYHKYPSANLFGLPDDVIHQILLNLPIVDVLNLSESCKSLHRTVKEDSLWFRLYNRDFADGNNNEGKCWRDAYVKAYLTLQEEKFRICNNVALSLQEFADLPNYTTRVQNSQWEVIL